MDSKQLNQVASETVNHRVGGSSPSRGAKLIHNSRDLCIIYIRTKLLICAIDKGLCYSHDSFLKETTREIIARHAYNRKQRVRNATPQWADLIAIEDIYRKRDRLNNRLRRSQKRNPYVVDHIIPLNGKTICGLHVPENMRIIRRSENSIKCNKWTEADLAVSQ